MQTFKTEPSAAELASILDPQGRALALRIKDTSDKLTVRPSLGCALWVVICIVFPLGGGVGYFSLVEAFRKGLAHTDVWVIVGAFAFPFVITLLLFWRPYRDIRSRGDYFVLDKTQRTLVLPRIGLTVPAEQIHAFFELQAWTWSHLLIDRRHRWNWTGELSVLVRNANQEIVRYPVVVSDQVRKVSRLGDRLAEFFQVQHRVLKLDRKTREQLEAARNTKADESGSANATAGGGRGMRPLRWVCWLAFIAIWIALLVLGWGGREAPNPPLLPLAILSVALIVLIPVFLSLLSEELASGPVLRVHGREYSLSEGECLSAKEIPGLAAASDSTPLAAVSPHPADASVLGLKNLSRTTWTATLSDGKRRSVYPGRSLRLAPGTRVRFATAGEATIVAGSGANEYRLEVDGRSLELSSGQTLTAGDLAGIVAEVVRNPRGPEALALKNLSASPWQATVDGVDRDVAPGQTVLLKAGVHVSFGASAGTVALLQPSFRQRLQRPAFILFAGIVIPITWVVAWSVHRPPPWAQRPQFAPAPDPAGVAVAPISQVKGGAVSLADGASVTVPPDAVPGDTVIHVQRLLNDPGNWGSKGLVGKVYDINLGNTQPDQQPYRGVRVTLPFDKDRLSADQDGWSLALARWNGYEWRPVGSEVDQAGGKVSARVQHFGTYGVVATSRFEAGPAELVLQGTIRPRIPRGATVVCRVDLNPSASDEYKQVRITNSHGKPACEIQDPQSKTFTPGAGPVEDRRFGDGRWRSLRFIVRVPADAELGPCSIDFNAGPPLTNAFEICAPLVVIVNIDGLRQDTFYRAVSASSACPNIRNLVGQRLPDAPTAPGTIGHALQFKQGVALLETTTVFPTVTFAGQAAIASGGLPRDYLMAGNEWFDRKGAYKFAFTGDNIGPTGAGDCSKDGFANKRLLRSGLTTLYQDAAADPQLRATSAVFRAMYFGDGLTAARWSRPKDPAEQARAAAVFDAALRGEPPPLTPAPVAGGYLTLTSAENDRSMIDQAIGEGLQRRDAIPSVGDPSVREYNRLSIMTLYYAGLDHSCHEGGEPASVEDRDGKPGRQTIYLQGTIDSSLGKFLGAMSEVTYKNTFFVFIADHGQTTVSVTTGADADLHCFRRSRSLRTLHKFQDLLFELGYAPNGNYPPHGAASRQRPADIKLTSAVVGLNGGTAQVYLRRLRQGKVLSPRLEYMSGKNISADPPHEEPVAFESWAQPPSFSQVLQAAEWYRKNLIEPPPGPAGRNEYQGSLAFILVRDVEHGGGAAPYQVYRSRRGDPRPGEPEHDLVSFDQFLKQPDGKAFLRSSGWHDDDRDAAHLVYGLHGLESDMAGDLLLVANYPSFYCEYDPQYGDNGSFNRQDFEIPFVVAQPGADQEQLKFIKDALAKSVDLTSKNRPANTDVKKTVLALLTPPASPANKPSGPLAERARRAVRAAGLSPLGPAPDPPPYIWTREAQAPLPRGKAHIVLEIHYRNEDEDWARQEFQRREQSRQPPWLKALVYKSVDVGAGKKALIDSQPAVRYLPSDPDDAKTPIGWDRGVYQDGPFLVTAEISCVSAVTFSADTDEAKIAAEGQKLSRESEAQLVELLRKVAAALAAP
jgi:hypothetical protein